MSGSLVCCDVEACRWSGEVVFSCKCLIFDGFEIFFSAATEPGVGKNVE